MMAILAAGIRLLILYIAARFIWSLFSSAKNTIPPGKNKGAPPVQRFDAGKENISDGEFKDV
jgi:hypothetical protein